jgi:hypothetical protein
MPNPLLTPLLRFASGLRFPTLFWITAGLFVVNLVIPDVVPFADELLLGLLALLFGSLKRGGVARR